jgi:prepilin-type processing-associated H-X9-DG protein
VDDGYALNLYPLAPQPDSPDTSLADANVNTVERVIVGLPLYGWYFKATKWTHSAERALIYDSIESQGVVNPTWPWWVVPGPMPTVADAYNFSPDFNRHGRGPGTSGPDDRNLNMLFCDGHAASVSAREAFTAIRMMPASD